MTPTKYTKTASSIQDQINILQERKLVISNIPFAEHYLTHVGYYRLAGYWRIYQIDTVNHIFGDEITFEQVIELYNFDRNLRSLIFDAIESIEISLRTVMLQIMCEAYGMDWFQQKKLAQHLNYWQENLDKIEDELDRSKEDFVVHHDQVYGKKDFPPAWKVMQVLSFGTLSKIYSNITSTIPEKNKIARALGMPNYKYLVSWLQTISILRNLCAHHSRVSNRVFNFVPQKMATSHLPWLKVLPVTMEQQRSLYNQLCSIKFLLNVVSPGNEFTVRLVALSQQYPLVDLAGPMGFPSGWRMEPLWLS
ncbi:Abi family protein [Chitinophaga sp. sic0106]|uniref:Abi family protein n=1 Tax=Chitinophaga sp. sic0106 TaxID=2854785 RepID=UPI001C485AC3|nr:Abi family protein [Chitinophaga sp. sic0106]MBV7531608.1 Abi family protein [Chitinophaga sp. sic0106]